jgi:hypothetical protein
MQRRRPSNKRPAKIIKPAKTVLIAAVVAVATAFVALGGASASAQTSAQTSAPSAVRALVASAFGDQATVSWQAPASGTAARYQVEAYLGGYTGSYFGTQITTATQLSWSGLPLGEPVQFEVTPIGPDGPGGVSGPAGPVNYTGTVTPTNSYCPAGASGDCVVVNTTEGQGAMAHPGSGLLHGTVPGGDPLVSALQLTHWRISAVNTYEYANASAYVPKDNIIEVISDAWYNATESQNGGYAADPWANWTNYTNYVKAVVYYSELAGQNPYWEVQNEPENYPYSPKQPPTRALVEDEYLYAYQAIKSVDPNARVVGPSIDWAYENPSWPIDMKSFIAFASANAMKFSAIAWHDNCCQTDSNPLSFDQMPQAVADEAEQVRTLLAEYPGIGSPQLFVDENSSPSGQFSPGWEAGYLASEQAAGIAFGGRTCWDYPSGGDAGAYCGGPYLDQILNLDGQPNASYWTMADYAAMSGTTVASASSDANLSSLAATDSAGTTTILLGRHQTCSGWTAGSTSCPVVSAPAPVATTVTVLVPTGATSATVSVQEIADNLLDLPSAPATTTTTVPVSSGKLTVSIPSFGDGESYFLTVKPNATSGSAPPSGDQAATQSPPASGTPVPTRIITEAGDYQVAAPGQALPEPLTALVTDQYGNPMAGVGVTFYMWPGTGFLPGGASSALTFTNSVGIATSPTITVGLSPGYLFLIAYVSSPAISPAPTCYFGYWIT